MTLFVNFIMNFCIRLERDFMSMISNLVEELIDNADLYTKELHDLMYRAAETIEVLSEKAREQEWISCSERLPEPYKAVLGYAPRHQNVYAVYYDSAYGWMIWSPIESLISDESFPETQGEIVAWMPLPEPWRREDNEDDR